MLLTARSALEALEQAPPGATRAELARVLSRGSLLGARGNSGVIASQILRGALDSLAAGDTPADALAAARDAGYAAVREPVEGTILSMIRELAEEAAVRGDLAAGELLPALVRRGREALARTPEQLPILREAGVVDAGAAGLLEIVRGLAAAVAGEALPPPADAEPLALDAVHQELSRYRYCTVFAVEGDDLDARALEERLAPLGDSLLVVGERTLLKVHVHTDDPGAALSAGAAVGVLERVEVANMHRQTEAREERLLHELDDDGGGRATDVVAVVAGSGNAELFRSLGAARIVDGGRTMNPSAEQIRAAIDATTAPEVLVLPNNGNVLLAAEQAAALAARPARVLPTRSLQEGLAALVVYDGFAPADENEAAMGEAAAAVGVGAVTVAARDVDLPSGKVRTGEYLGLVAGEPAAGGAEFAAVAAAVVERLLAGPREVLTLLTGEEEPPLGELLELLHERHPEVEVEVHEGGQPHYLLLVAAE
jgi:fatty acid kinase